MQRVQETLRDEVHSGQNTNGTGLILGIRMTHGGRSQHRFYLERFGGRFWVSGGGREKRGLSANYEC